MILVKAVAKMPEISPALILHHIRDTKTRQAWDRTFDSFCLIDCIDNVDVVYCYLKAPFPVASREFCQYRRTVVDPETNVIKILHRSACHDKCPEPTSNWIIRAESVISGYIIKPTPYGCELFLAAQTDVKGLIPQWVVNTGAQKAPVNWILDLRKACNQFIKSQKPIPDYVPSFSMPPPR